MSRQNATLSERGNGLPDVGDYVPGDDGQLYRVTERGQLNTGLRPGESNWCRAVVELVDWSDCPDGEEHTAQAIVSEDS